jgi:hypothetical protein
MHARMSTHEAGNKINRIGIIGLRVNGVGFHFIKSIQREALDVNGLLG